MKVWCDKCKKDVTLICKMGGLICSKCRTILYVRQFEAIAGRIERGEV